MRATLIAGFLALFAAAALTAQMPKYKVTATADKGTDFSRLKTYAWEPGWQAHDRTAHEQIVAAVDRELAALGFTKAPEGQSDVTVVYATVQRTDVDLKSKARTAEGQRPTFPVATLVVMIREPGTHKQLFRARVDTPIELEPERIKATIDDRVAQMFARYPKRHSNQQ
jgi:hypothetical protein